MVPEIGRLYIGPDERKYRVLDIEVAPNGRQTVVVRDGRNRGGAKRFPMRDAAKWLREITPSTSEPQGS